MCHITGGINATRILPEGIGEIINNTDIPDRVNGRFKRYPVCQTVICLVHLIRIGLLIILDKESILPIQKNSNCKVLDIKKSWFNKRNIKIYLLIYLYNHMSEVGLTVFVSAKELI